MPNAAHCESDSIGFEPEVDSKLSITTLSYPATIHRQSLVDRARRAQAGLIRLPPAVAAAEAFLHRVYASTREDELQLFDWNDDR
jgi:hypothetical protein